MCIGSLKMYWNRTLILSVMTILILIATNNDNTDDDTVIVLAS